MNALIQYALYLIILVALAIPLGSYIGKVMNNEPVFLSKILRPVKKASTVFWASTRMKRWAGKNTLLVPLRFSLSVFLYLPSS